MEKEARAAKKKAPFLVGRYPLEMADKLTSLKPGKGTTTKPANAEARSVEGDDDGISIGPIQGEDIGPFEGPIEGGAGLIEGGAGPIEGGAEPIEGGAETD